MNIRLPNIQGDTQQQLQQIKSYLYQLAQELNFALDVSGDRLPRLASQPRNDSQEKQTAETWNGIKALIIKSADIVNAYYDEISRRLEGSYVAQSDFGEFTENTIADITANANAIGQNYEHVQRLLTDVRQSITDVAAYINTGLLYYDDDGAPVYGMEIGQRTTQNGEQVFNKFARFTSDKLAFYDGFGSEVAYISDRKLRIPNALVEKTLTRGGYEDAIEPDGSVTTRWVGI